MIYMEMPTTNTRTASAESVSAIFIFVSAIFDFVSAKIQNGSAKFVSSAWKSRYGGDSSSDPYFMGANLATGAGSPDPHFADTTRQGSLRV